jgi:hypothetical protein
VVDKIPTEYASLVFCQTPDLIITRKNKGAKVILSLRVLVQSKGRWQQFWEKVDQYGAQIYA